MERFNGQVKKCVRKAEEQIWRDNMNNKSSLALRYRKAKQNIKVRKSSMAIPTVVGCLLTPGEAVEEQRGSGKDTNPNQMRRAKYV